MSRRLRFEAHDDEALVASVRRMVEREQAPRRLGSLDFRARESAGRGLRRPRSAFPRFAPVLMTVASATAILAIAFAGFWLRSHQAPTTATALPAIAPTAIGARDGGVARLWRQTFSASTKDIDASPYDFLYLASGATEPLPAHFTAKYPSVKTLSVMSPLVEKSRPKGNGVCFPYHAGAGGIGGVPLAYFLRDSKGAPLYSSGYGGIYYLDPSNSAVQKACADAAISQAAGYTGTVISGLTPRLNWSGMPSCPGGTPACVSDAAIQDAGTAFLNNVVPILHSHGLVVVVDIQGAYGGAKYQPIWARWSTIGDGAREGSFAMGSTGKPVPDGQVAEELQNEAWSETHHKYLLGYGNVDAKNQTLSTYGLGLMLMEAGGYSSWSVVVCDTCSGLPAEYGAAQSLGAPLGSSTFSGTTYTRRFKNGTVTVDLSTHTAVIH